MKYAEVKNKNYCATVVRVKKTVPLANCDNIVGFPCFGYQAIVSKDTKEGDIGILFPAEVQLSDSFVRANNLYRHNAKNADIEQKGYIEDNRRVRAVKFRGNRSDALFLPLTSLQYLGLPLSALKEGDEFDTLEGEEICRKYVIETRHGNNITSSTISKRVDVKFIPEHIDSANYFKYKDQLNKDVEVIVTQKLHGTSIRIANTIVKRNTSLLEKILRFFRVKIQETEFDYVFGSKKVIKDVNNSDQNHYYDVDIWTMEGKKLEGTLPENYIVYGELVGWTPMKAPIQKDYTYMLPEGQCELYVYRIAIINGQGILIDLSWDQVKEFCQQHGLKAVKELWRGKLRDFTVEAFLDKQFSEIYTDVVPLDAGIVDEGVCIRIDKLTPYILKAKSPLFLEHESKQLDSGEIDLETEGSEVACMS